MAFPYRVIDCMDERTMGSHVGEMIEPARMFPLLNRFYLHQASWSAWSVTSISSLSCKFLEDRMDVNVCMLGWVNDGAASLQHLGAGV